MRNIFLTFLALSLSFVGIPIYINISDFYARKYGISLVIIGLFLAIVRFIDSIQDPLIGKISDNLSQQNISRKITISVSGILLCIFFFLVFNPPENIDQNLATLWFFITLSVTYFCFNFIFINFESIIAINSKNDQERITLNSFKEFFGIIGMILAFTIPTILAKYCETEKVYQNFSLIFAILLILGLIFLSKSDFHEIKTPNYQKIKLIEIIKDKEFSIFIKIFFFNSLAVSLPAANLNFYIKDVLKSETNLGLFLSIYFISACLFIPLWQFIAQKTNIIKSWTISLLGSFLIFLFAYFLEEKSANLFYFICFFSGIFLGADLIFPPVIMARITSKKENSVSSYFAVWNFLTKIAIMFAASISSIFLGLFGYQPSEINTNTSLIPFFYAFLPCLIKCYVFILLLTLKKKNKLLSP